MRATSSFHHLEAAYQLHFYLCFKTKRLRPFFLADPVQQMLRDVVDDVCQREDYHLLEMQISPDHLRLLLSLKPDQNISRVVQLLKGNISRQFSLRFPNELTTNRAKTIWAEGYFARSSGKANIEAARNYIDRQASHHGFSGEWTEALRYRNPNFKSPAFTPSHCFSRLDYHLVVVTKFRAQVFDEVIAPKLVDYVLEVGARRGFAVERMSLMPDHIHLLVEAMPSVSVMECALSLVNNTHYWMEKNYRGVLKQTGALDMWQPTFYAGTVGEYETAQMKRFLRRD